MSNPWKINEYGYFEADSLAALVFNNFYEEGKQGGIELIQHGERVMTDGDVRLETAPGQWAPLPKLVRRTADPARGEIRIDLEYKEPALAFSLIVRAVGDALQVVVDLPAPLPDALNGKVGLNLELLPSAYFGMSYQMGDSSGVFPRQLVTPVAAAPGGECQPMAMGTGGRLVIAAEQPLRRCVIELESGEMQLLDGRSTTANGWFIVRSLIPAGRSGEVVRWLIKPHSIPGWRRQPVICHSQVGYHPAQEKKAIIELDARSGEVKEAALLVIGEGDPQVACSGLPKKWGRFFYYNYAIFDFTEVKKSGLYRIRYGDVETAPFVISPTVYQQGVWQPTLETFMPVQMCHMTVRDGYRIWHGACHLDDALQAPTPHEHFDGYRQGGQTDTPYKPLEHIPNLDVGGWHDAGDYDLAAGSQANTTFKLALVRECFGLDSDQTTVRRKERLVKLHAPDGVPDIIHQIVHGVENLLSGYRAVGHSFSGIIESTLELYVHLGDAATMTDNRIYDSTLPPDEVKGDRSGRKDDRWVFTNRDTALEYQVITALAAASRVLRGFEPALAEECLQTALKVWDYEQAHKPVAAPSSYNPGNVAAQEIMAAVELLITTGEEKYRRRLYKMWDKVVANCSQVGWSVARAIPRLDDTARLKRLETALKSHQEELVKLAARNPFGVPLHPLWLDASENKDKHYGAPTFPLIWGITWRLESLAVEAYFLQQAYPAIFHRDLILRVLNYVLGCHPYSDKSLVSAVGAESLTIAYGTNRAEWSHIPGGVVSGPNLIRPIFPELLDPFPFLWQQKEYVIGGAADYIFIVLAADALLNQ